MLVVVLLVTLHVETRGAEISKQPIAKNKQPPVPPADGE